MSTVLERACVCKNLFCGKCLVCESVHQSVFLSLHMHVRIVVCGSGRMWVFPHVLANKSGTLLLSCFQESFHKGLWYPPLPTPAQKWCSAFVANPCFLNWLHPLGKQNTFYRQAWETLWQNRLQTVSMGTEVLITSVSLFFSSLFPLSLSSTICHCLSFCLGRFLLLCVNVQKFPMGADGEKKTDPGNILYRLP